MDQGAVSDALSQCTVQQHALMLSVQSSVLCYPTSHANVLASTQHEDHDVITKQATAGQYRGTAKFMIRAALN